MVSSEQEAKGYENTALAYQRQFPDTKIRLHYYSERKYKSSIAHWLKTSRFDLLYWQAGRQRLFELAEQGLLADVSDIWQASQLDEHFPASIKPLVTYNDKRIAIPYSYYHWGVFYNKSVFETLSLQPPKTLDEMLDICDVMSAHDVIPVALGLRHQWPVLAWFSYIALRLEGLSFYNKLMDGNISWQSPEVVNIMRHWRTLFQRCHFNTDAAHTSLDVSSRTLVKGTTGLMLTGNFMQTRLTEQEVEQLDFFPFPMINPEIEFVESAPVEVWVLPKSSKNRTTAEAFLRFFLSHEHLASLNRHINYFSPDKRFHDNQRIIASKGIALLQAADGLMQYFDRDAPIAIVETAQSVFMQFIVDGNIESAIDQLEKQRLAIHSQAPAH